MFQRQRLFRTLLGGLVFAEIAAILATVPYWATGLLPLWSL